jgi:hypothetical protein
MTHIIEELKKTDKKMNNHSNNPNRSNKHDMWIMKWVRSKACESELVIRDSKDM